MQKKQQTDIASSSRERHRKEDIMGKELEGYVRLTAETEEIMGRKSSSWKYMMV